MRNIVLVVDDMEINRELLAEILKDEYDVIMVENGKQALEYMENRNQEIAVVLLDLIMPEMDGFEVLKVMQEKMWIDKIPVLVISGESSIKVEQDCFDYGVSDFIHKPFDNALVRKRVENVVSLFQYQRELEEKVAEKVEEIESMYDLMTISFAGLVESRDGVTGGHLKNTSLFFKLFIEYLMELPRYRDELPESLVRRACRSAPLHDVGKIAIEDAVLRKAGGLSKEEFEQMKMHSVIGGDIFAFIKGRIPDREFAEVAEQIARCHHEKWNGSGYPDGLKGKNIPLVARIMSIVDVYDALTSKRPYKEPFSHERAMIMIAEKSGIEFDPELVNEFLNIEDRIKECLHVKEQMITEQQYFMVHCNKNF